MQYGMPTLIENQSLAQNIALCTRLGLSFIELNMNFPEYQLECLEQTDTLIEAAERARIYYTIHLDERLDIADFNTAVADAYFETVRRAIFAAKKLVPLKDTFGAVDAADAATTAEVADGGHGTGTTPRTQPLILNMHMNHGIYITLPDRKTFMYERDFAKYMKSFERFKNACEDWIDGADILITLENTDGFKNYEKQAIELLLQSPVFALTWDIGHSKAVGETDVPFIKEHADRLVHFHIHDGTETPPKNHLALGNGEIDLQERLAFAKSRGARCVLETKTIAALEKSVKWLKKAGFYTEASSHNNADVHKERLSND